MQTLELECPACSELLELDMGFAGGVCRCSACGTLMTVPQDAAQGAQAEQLSRPDRPDDPSGLSGMAPSSAAPSPRTRERSSSRSSSRSSRGNKRGKADRRGRGKKTGKQRGGSSRAGGVIEQGVYTTASGRTVKIDRTTDVPMARQRRAGVRIATTAVFFSIVGVIALVGGMAVVYMIQNPKGGKPEAGTEEPYVEPDPTQFQFNPSTNPFMIDQPNAVGFPLTGTVAIVIDTSAASSDWLGSMAEMLGTGLSRPGSDARVMIYAADSTGVRTFRGAPSAASTASAEALASFLVADEGADEGMVGDAINDALDASPDTIILIVGGPGEAEVDTWGRLLKAHPDLPVHGVLMGFSFDFGDWIEDRNADSRLIELGESGLENWRADWRAETEADE